MYIHILYVYILKYLKSQVTKSIPTSFKAVKEVEICCLDKFEGRLEFRYKTVQQFYLRHMYYLLPNKL